MDGSWFWPHPIDAQLDWDLENEEASFTPWVLCHEGVQLICNSHFPVGFPEVLCSLQFGFAELFYTFHLCLLNCCPVVRFAFGFATVLCSLPFGFAALLYTFLVGF